MARKTSLFFAALLVFGASSAAAAQPTAESVIYVGPAQWTPFLGPIHWSPNGAYVAYFNRDTLMVCDTLGNTRPISQFDWRPRRMGWVTDSSIAVNSQESSATSGTHRRLVVLDTRDGSVIQRRTPVRTEATHYAPESTYVDGPFCTIEGDAYITMLGGGDARTSRWHDFVLLDSSGAESGRMAHFFSLTENGLYEVTLDQSDSVRIAPNLFGLHRQAFHISRDGKYVINESLVMRLADSSIVNLESIQPGTDECDLMFTQMHPTEPVAICMRGCSISDSEEVSQAVVYDIASRSYHFLDEFVDAGGCKIGYFNRSGSYIAVLCSGGLYLLKWPQ